MKLVLISDVHGNKENIEKLKNEFDSCDGIVFAGDFTEFNKEETGLPALEALSKCHENIFAVLGNCDNPELMEKLDENDISVDSSIVFHEGLAFAGSSGGSVFTKTTPNERTEEELLSDFDVIKNACDSSVNDQWNNLIVVSHNPPKNTSVDQCAPGVHVGSESLYNFIKEIKPLAVVTGHIHEGTGIDHIGETVVVNPGALFEGKYAVMDIEKKDGRWTVKNTELRNL